MPAAPTGIRFAAKLLRPAAPKNATWRFLVLPKAGSAKLPARVMVSVEGSFAGHAFTATLEPDGEGSHWLKVPRALWEKAGVAQGDMVALDLRPVAKEPEPRLPPDLRKALAEASDAQAQWKTLTAVARRDFIQWLASAKQAETRARRIRNACDMLACGKRRICCFDRSGQYSRGTIGAPAAAD